jgi:hypothetical protein
MVLHFVSCGADPSSDWLMLANECLEKMAPANVQRSRTWLVAQRLPIPPVLAEYKPDLKPGAHRDSKVRPIMGLERLLNSKGESVTLWCFHTWMYHARATLRAPEDPPGAEVPRV